jgi:hypothetical protein
MVIGWPAVRTPWRRRTVRTDAPAALRRYDSVPSHLVLRDVYGHRLELDARILVAQAVLHASGAA